MVITTSPNVSNFDFDALLDISTATAKAVLTDISTYISGGQADIIGINFKIIDPNNIAFHDTVYPPDVDLTPGLTDYEVNLPSFNGAVKWGVYKIYATLIDEDGTQYEWTENGLNYKAIRLCKPNTLVGATGSFGGMQLLSDFDCDTNTLLVEDGTAYVYNGVAATEIDTDVTVTYPVDPTGTPSYQTSTFIPFTLPISLSGVYSITALVIQTYDYTETTHVKVAYKYQKSTDVQCGFTLCKALCEYERLADDIKNCVYKTIAQTNEKQRQFLLISGLLVKILSFGKICGKSFNTATILEEIREIGGFDCNCDCTPAAIIPQPVYAHNTIVKGSMCGDIDMVLTQVGSSVLISLSDKHYDFDVDESIADWVTVTPVEDGCNVTWTLNIDFCSAIAALGCGGGGGSGTVTDFTAGNLSPLFTTSVATSNTTPALSFAQISQNQNLVYASPDGVAGVPTFRALVAADIPTLTGYWALAGNATGNDTSFLGTTTNNDFLFKTNSTTRGAFLKTGELGINIIAAPLGTLHVKGQVGQSPLYVVNNGGTGFAEFTNAGNLGVGVSPTSTIRLHVAGVGTTSATHSFHTQNSDNSVSLTFRDDGHIYRNGSFYSKSSTFTNRITTWGINAGADITSGGDITLIGHFAGRGVTTGTAITIIGAYPGTSAIHGTGTTAVGSGSLQNVTGDNNTALGRSAGRAMTTGTVNIYIGSYADVNDSSTALTNLTGSYNIVMGGINGTSSTAFVGGNAFSSVWAVHGVGTISNQIVFGGGMASTYYTSLNIGYSAAGAKHSTYYRTSTPESAQVGTMGDIVYVNTGAAGEIYIKATGAATNTGWLQLTTGTSGAYLLASGATTGAGSQAQVFTNGIKASSIDDNGDGSIDFVVGSIIATFNAGGLQISPAGTAISPAITFGTNTHGFYEKSATELGASVAGVLVGGFDATGVFAGLAGTLTGTVKFNGATSGTVTLKSAAAAGTWTLTLPATDGNANEFLQTDGAGVTTWAVPAGTGANTALSNLSAVSINASLIPQTTLDLGAAATAWRSIYFYGAGTFATTSFQLTGTPTGNRVVTFADATQTVANLSTAQTFITAVKTFNSSILAIRNPADTFSYTIAGGAIGSNLVLSLPVITGADVVAVQGLDNAFSVSQSFAANIAVNVQARFTGAVLTATLPFRTTNGGSNVNARMIAGDSAASAGNLAVAIDPTNMLTFLHSNGTRHIAGAAISIANLDNTAGSEDSDLIFLTQSGGTLFTQKMRITGLGSIIIGAEAAIATNATDGFLYIPTCAGTPNGVPTGVTGKVALVYDSTNNMLMIYDGAWLGATNPGAFT